MHKLVYDPLDCTYQRYKSTIYLDYIKTKETSLKKGTRYTYDSISCTREVRNTKSNWFYILPLGVNREDFTRWIEELKPNFPTLDLEILPESSYLELKENLVPSSDHHKSKHLEYTNFSNETGKLITLKTKDNYEIIDLYFILEDFLQVYKTLVKPITILEAFEYYLNNLKIKNLLDKKSRYRSFFKNNYSNEVYIYLSEININGDNFYQYVKEILYSNEKYLTSQILFQSTELHDRIILKVLHTKRTYSLESYLIHHFIRAGISPELNIFVNQYYRVKELKPDLYFWNAILIAQMGFSIYEYWWLTGVRRFKLLSKEKFEKLIKNYSSDSSNDFFRKLQQNYSPVIQNKIIALYKNENIEELCKIILGSVNILTLKPEKLTRFINLKLKSTYSIESEQDDFFFIKGDDERIRRYKKSNFNIDEL